MSDRPSPSTPGSAPDPLPTYTWRARPEFGPWLRELREARGLSIRAAAAEMRTSYSKLQKLESGGRVRPPSSEMMTAIAALYGVPVEEVLEQAGFHVDVPPDLKDALRCEESFAALVLHPDLRPVRMDERWLEAFSRLQKAQWVDFARKLEAHLRAGGAPVATLLRA